MACACGKNKPKQSASPNRPVRPASAPTPTTREAVQAKNGFTLTASDGTVQTFGSRLEAQAAYVRAGRRGILR